MNRSQIKFVPVALIMLCITHFAFGSFTGSSDKKSHNLFSLKNFNKNFYKNSGSFSLRTNLTFKGFQIIGQKKDSTGNVTVSAMMRFESGNTTYIYPYKHKIIVPKFKTPTPEIR